MGARTRRNPTPSGEAPSGEVDRTASSTESNAHLLERLESETALQSNPEESSYLEMAGNSGGNRIGGSASIRNGRLHASLQSQQYGSDGGTESSQGMDFRMGEHDARAGFTTSEGSGADRRGMGVWGQAGTGPGDAGGSMGGSIQRGRRSVTAHGGRTVGLELPEQIAPGVFAVSGTTTVELGGGGRQSFGSGRDLRGSVGVNASGSRAHSYRRVFRGPDAAEQAAAFYRDPRQMRYETTPDTFEGAMALEVGERAGVTDTATVGGSIRALSTVGISLSGSLEGAQGVQMERVDETTLQISATYRGEAEGSPGLSVAGTGFGYDAGAEHQQTSTFRIDLDHPDAAAVFAAIRAGSPPQGTEGPGWRRTRMRVVDTRTSGGTASLFGQELAGPDSYERQVDETERGRQVQETWSGDDAGVSTTAFRHTDYDFAPGASRRENEHDYGMESVVRRDDLDQSQDAMADLSGGLDGSATGSAEGDWTVEAAYSEAQYMHFARDIATQTRPPGTLSPRLHDEWHALRQAIRRDPHDTEAMGAFLQTTGVDGVRVFRESAGEPTEQFTSLSGDGNFLGRGRSERMGERVTEIEASIDVDGADLTGCTRSVQQQRRRLRHRFDAISAEGAYADLPASLRASELLRLEGWMQRLDQVQRELYQRRRREVEEPAGAESVDEARNLLEDITGAALPATPGAEQLPVEPRAAYRELTGTVQRAQETLLARREQAHRLWTRHNQIMGSNESPRDRYTGGMMWLAGDAMDDGYAAMENILSEADGQFSVADDALQSANGQVLPEDLDEDVSRMLVEGLRNYRNAQGFSRLSSAAYDRVIAGLTRMRDRQMAQSPEVWGQPSE